MVVEAFKWHFRPAWHAHRVLGKRAKADFPLVERGKFLTIVWKTQKLREWGFWCRGGRTHWRRHVQRGCD